jgi:hypothetical protein
VRPKLPCAAADVLGLRIDHLLCIGKQFVVPINDDLPGLCIRYCMVKLGPCANDDLFWTKEHRWLLPLPAAKEIMPTPCRGEKPLLVV